MSKYATDARLYAALLVALLLPSCASFCFSTGGTWSRELDRCSRIAEDGGKKCKRGADCEAGICLVEWEEAATNSSVTEGQCAERTHVRYYGGLCTMVDKSEAWPEPLDDDAPNPVRSSTATWVQCSIVD